MASHISEDDLTLYYYGEGRRRDQIEQHLDDCPACAAVYREIAATLALIAAPDTPERGAQYGLEVWQRLRHRLPERQDEGFAGFARFTRFIGFIGFIGFTGFTGFTIHLPQCEPAGAWSDIRILRSVGSGLQPAGSGRKA